MLTSAGHMLKVTDKTHMRIPLRTGNRFPQSQKPAVCPDLSQPIHSLSPPTPAPTLPEVTTDLNFVLPLFSGPGSSVDLGQMLSSFFLTYNTVIS